MSLVWPRCLMRCGFLIIAHRSLTIILNRSICLTILISNIMVNIKSHDFYTVFDDKKQLFKVSSLFDSLDESEDIVKDLMDSGTFMYVVDERLSMIWVDIFMMIELLGEYDGGDVKDLAIKCSSLYLKDKVMRLIVDYVNCDSDDYDDSVDPILSYCSNLIHSGDGNIDYLPLSDMVSLNVGNYMSDDMLKLFDIAKEDNRIISILFVLLSRPYVDDYGLFTLTDLLSMMIDKGFIGDRDDIVNVLGFILK
nr:MAG TPA: hypothetical protein [Caudoviricetes sp.]